MIFESFFVISCIRVLSVRGACGSNFNSPATSSDIFACLFENPSKPYFPDIDPTINLQAVDIKIFTESLHVNYVDEQRQVLFAPLLISVVYQDPRLQWDANSTGVKAVRVANSRIWRPNVFSPARYFSSDGKDEDYDKFEYSTLHFDGVIEWMTILKDEIRCEFNNFRFPLDSIMCRYTMHSKGNKLSPLSIRESCQLKLRLFGEDTASLDECETLTLESFKSGGKNLRNPAGWAVKLENDGDVSLLQALQFTKNRELVIHLARNSATDFIVWVITPIVITTVAIVSIFYLW